MFSIELMDGTIVNGTFADGKLSVMAHESITVGGLEFAMGPVLLDFRQRFNFPWVLSTSLCSHQRVWPGHLSGARARARAKKTEKKAKKLPKERAAHHQLQRLRMFACSRAVPRPEKEEGQERRWR